MPEPLKLPDFGWGLCLDLVTSRPMDRQRHGMEVGMARWLAVIVGLVLAIGLALGVAYALPNLLVVVVIIIATKVAPPEMQRAPSCFTRNSNASSTVRGSNTSIEFTLQRRGFRFSV